MVIRKRNQEREAPQIQERVQAYTLHPNSKKVNSSCA